jgi:tetratricopeptide (TPR) repeat protein
MDGRAAVGVGRNDPCPCGSGRKYKQCCAQADQAAAAAAASARAQLSQGRALEKAGQPARAIEAYRAAAGFAATAAEALSRIGHLSLSLGRAAEAVSALKAAAAVPAATPKDALARRLDLVRALVVEKQDAAAEAEVRRVLADDPQSADGHWLLGRLLAESGRFEEARDALARATELDPANGGAWYDLVRSYDLTEADRPLVARMLAADRAVGDTDGRMRLQLALGKAFDDLGEPEQAMRRFDRAAALSARIARFDRAAFEARVEALVARFSPAFLAAHAAGGDPSARPVMVLGLPRSGTTLVEQILSSHAEVAGGGELPFWPANGPVFERLAEGRTATFQAQAAAAYLAVLDEVAPGAARVVDKTPANFLWAGLIHLAFPNAAIVHCRRSLADTCLSIHGTYFAPRPDFPADAADLVAYAKAYQRLTAHWRAVLPPERFVEVEYERLVSQPEPQIRALVGALGLAWDPACLRPEANARVVRTPSRRQARQPVTGAAVGRARRYGPWLGPLADLM